LERRSVVLVIVVAVLAAGLILTLLARGRQLSARESSRNNLRVLAAFAATYSEALAKKQNLPERAAIPAGTLFQPKRKPDERPSWVPACLPFFDQRRQDTLALLPLVDPLLAWNEGSNAELGMKPLAGLLCPAGGDASPRTDYVGLGGLGVNAAAEPLGHRSGAFRYDSATPLELILNGDGLSNSFIFAETRRDNGHWLRGGPSTLRGLIVEDLPYIGREGQFGGFHVEGGLFAAADGSVRMLTPKVDARVFRALLTILGGPEETPRVEE
jgi:hypothetical protein